MATWLAGWVGGFLFKVTTFFEVEYGKNGAS